MLPQLEKHIKKFLSTEFMPRNIAYTYCHYSALVLDNDTYREGDSNACFAWISRWRDGSRTKRHIAYMLFYVHPTEEVSLEAQRAYIDYVVNESPFKQGFVSTAEEIFETRVAVKSADVAGNVMLAGMMALRNMYEFPMQATIWYELVKNGVDKHLAFVMKEHGYISGDKIRWDKVQEAQHKVIAARIMDETALKNFLTCNYQRLGKPFKEVEEIKDINAMFIPPTVEVVWYPSQTISATWKAIKNEYVPTTVPADFKNPFLKAVDSRWNEEFDEGIKNMASFCQKLMGKLINA